MRHLYHCTIRHGKWMLGLCFDYRSSLVETAPRTNSVRYHGLRALGTLGQVNGTKLFVRSAFVSSSAGDPLLGNRHDSSFSWFINLFAALRTEKFRGAAKTRSEYTKVSDSTLAVQGGIFCLSRASASQRGSAAVSPGHLHSSLPFRAPHRGHSPGQDSEQSGCIGTSRRIS